MWNAKKLEVDQWIGNGVLTVAKRACVPKSSAVSMRWIITRKKFDSAQIDEARQTRARKAKARQVVA
eukprot:1631311-Lingulodinium_polyedra.AAC.1